MRSGRSLLAGAGAGTAIIAAGVLVLSMAATVFGFVWSGDRRADPAPAAVAMSAAPPEAASPAAPRSTGARVPTVALPSSSAAGRTATPARPASRSGRSRDARKPAAASRRRPARAAPSPAAAGTEAAVPAVESVAPAEPAAAVPEVAVAPVVPELPAVEALPALPALPATEREVGELTSSAVEQLGEAVEPVVVGALAGVGRAVGVPPAG